MSKTPFSSKCDVLGGLWFFYREQAEANEAWEEFFTYNDVGLPLAYMLAEEIVMPSEDGEAERLIDETWGMLCAYLSVDPDGEYTNINDIFEASPNPPLETTVESK